jgi:hypothetical protein
MFWITFTSYAGRLIAAALFAFAGPLLGTLGISMDALTAFVVSVIGGGASIASILSALKHALLSDPESFKAKVRARVPRP